MIQIQIGMSLIPRAVVVSERLLIRKLGLGLAVGSALTAVLSQILRLMIPTFGYVEFLVVFGVLSLLIEMRRYEVPIDLEKRDLFDQVWLLLLGTTFVLGLVTGWYLTLFFLLALSQILVRSFGRERKNRLSTYVLILFPALLAAIGFRFAVDYSRMRQVLWDGDNSIFQLIINTLEHWGIRENAGSIGRASFAGYHWASFSWAASLETVASSPAWVVIQFAVPVVVSVAVTAIFIDLICHFADDQFTLLGRTVVLLVVLGLSFRPDGSFSLYVSDLWLLGFLALLTLPADRTVLWKMFPGFGILLCAVLIGKRTTGAVLIVALLTTAIVLWFVKKENRQFLTMLFVAVASAVFIDRMIQVLVVLQSKDSLRDLSLGEGRVAFQFISESAFGFAGSSDGIRSIVLAIVVTTTIFSPFLVASFFAMKDGFYREIWFIVTFSTLCVSMLVPFFLDGEVLAVYYYARHPGTIAASVIVLLVLVLPRFRADMRQVLQVGRGRIVVAALMLLVAAWSFWLIWPSRLVGVAEGYTEMIRSAYWVPAFAASLFVFYCRGRFLAVLVSIVTLFSFFASFPKEAQEIVSERFIPMWSKEKITDLQDFPSKSMDSFSKWVKVSTNIDDVFGSNLFCDVKQMTEDVCNGVGWWDEMISRAQKSGYFAGNCKTATPDRVLRLQDYTLPSVFDRRFLIQGPNMSVWCKPDAFWVSDRIRASEEFAREATVGACQELVRDGVKYFIVDRRSTSRTTWNPYAQTRLLFEDLALLEIDVTSCQ